MPSYEFYKKIDENKTTGCSVSVHAALSVGGVTSWRLSKQYERGFCEIRRY